MEHSKKARRELQFARLIVDRRRCGNTTRFIDQFIQDLFNEGEVTIFDHYTGSNYIKINYRIIDIIGNRLRSEHNLNIVSNAEISSKMRINHVLFNKKTFTLKLID